MRRALIGVAALLAAAAAGSYPGAASAGHGRCGHVDVGYTSAKVTSQGVRCVRARRMVRRWVRRSDAYCDNMGRCRPMYVMGFRCVKGSSGYLVVLRCRDGDRRVRATWGD